MPKARQCGQRPPNDAADKFRVTIAGKEFLACVEADETNPKALSDFKSSKANQSTLTNFKSLEANEKTFSQLANSQALANFKSIDATDPDPSVDGQGQIIALLDPNSVAQTILSANPIPCPRIQFRLSPTNPQFAGQTHCWAKRRGGSGTGETTEAHPSLAGLG